MLVATDIAARGIDVTALGHVVNFDVPVVPEDYIHRVGRTARAEATGSAFTMVSPEEEGSLRDIEKAISSRLPRVTLPDFDYKASAAVSGRRATHTATPAVAHRAPAGTGPAPRSEPASPFTFPMTGPPYPAARAVAPKVHEHFVQHAADAQQPRPDRAVATPPDADDDRGADRRRVLGEPAAGGKLRAEDLARVSAAGGGAVIR